MGRVGVYTTARVVRGRIERLDRHAARLDRDADRLGLPRPDRRAIEALARAAVRERLGREDGVVRIEWSSAAQRSRPEPFAGEAAAPSAQAGSPTDRAPFTLLAETRPLGPEPRTWRAAIARALHPGPGAFRNAKSIDVPAWDAARAERIAAGVDEVLLFDAANRLVEGSRTNLIVVTAEGRLLTPALRLGPVEGLGLEIVREGLGPDALRESDAIDRERLASASELIAVNAVRGAAAIAVLDGCPMGDGQEGPVASRLRALFGRA